MAGCGKTKEEAKAPKYTIGVVTKSKSSEYWMSVCSGMERRKRKCRGCDFVSRFGDRPENTEKNDKGFTENAD